MRVARIAALVLGAIAIIGGIFAMGQNIAFLVALAFAIAASANLPTILYSLFWKRFNTRGALLEHLRRSHQRDHADHLQPGRVRQADRPRHGQEPVDAPGRRLPHLPARQPGHRLDPARLHPRVHRHGDEQGDNAAKYAEMPCSRGRVRVTGDRRRPPGIDATSALARSELGASDGLPWASDQAFWSIRSVHPKDASGGRVRGDKAVALEQVGNPLHGLAGDPPPPGDLGDVDGWSSTASRITQRARVWPCAGQRLAGGGEDAARPSDLEDKVGEGVAGRGPDGVASAHVYGLQIDNMLSIRTLNPATTCCHIEPVGEHRRGPDPPIQTANDPAGRPFTIEVPQAPRRPPGAPGTDAWLDELPGRLGLRVPLGLRRWLADF